MSGSFVISNVDEEEIRIAALRRLQKEPTRENLWEAVVLHQNQSFRMYSGLFFTYELHRGRRGEYTKELWIDRREKSKSLAWSSVCLAFEKVKEGKIAVSRPKDLGDIRGISYVYALFLQFGLIEQKKEEKRLEENGG